MPISNDLIHLRFYGEADDPPPIAVATLLTTASHLEQLVNTVAQVIAVKVKRNVLMIVAPPRRGCLEILFQPDFSVDTSGIRALANHAAGFGVDTSVLAEAAGIASFFWMTVFGGRGVIDLFRGQSTEPADDPFTMARIDLSTRALKQREVVDHVKRLLTTCAKSGFRRVEIQVRDEPVVVLFDRARAEPVVGRSWLETNGAFVSLEADELKLTQKSGDVLDVHYDGQGYKAFIANADGQPPIFVVWGSVRPVPGVGRSVRVVGRQIQDPGEIGLKNMMAYGIEDVGAAFFVRGELVAQ